MNSLRPLIIIAIAIALLYLYAWPQWNTIGTLRAQNIELQSALGKAQELTEIRNQLMEQYSSISPVDTERIGRVVPATYDPLKLITDVNTIGLRYGMMIRNIKMTSPAETSNTGTIEAVAPAEPFVKREFSFSTTGQYRNFISFLTELESSLQLMDIDKVEITTSTTAPKQAGAQTTGALSFNITLRTYWIQ